MRKAPLKKNNPRALPAAAAREKRFGQMPLGP
jgi:hypothetical protein